MDLNALSVDLLNKIELIYDVIIRQAEPLATVAELRRQLVHLLDELRAEDLTRHIKFLC